ncbi:MAG: hypothetical protein IH946_02255 [Bacteroidetes bacterium]|nr:hypothetical protein [Bacteroidota bacterium]
MQIQARFELLVNSINASQFEMDGHFEAHRSIQDEAAIDAVLVLANSSAIRK